MTQLGWHDVAAPDFSQALEGVRGFTSTVNQGLGQFKSTIGEIDQNISDKVNKSILLQLAGLHDAKTAQPAIDQILAQADPNRISAASIAAINARPGDLLSQANQQLQFDKTKHEYDRGLMIEGNQDAVHPLVNQAALLAASGNQKDATKIFTDNPELFGKVGINLPDLLSGNYELLNKKLGFDRGTFGFGREQITAGRDDADYAAQQEAAAALKQVDSKGYDADSRMAALRGLNLSPKAFEYALRGVGSLPDMGLGGGGGAAGAIAGAAGAGAASMTYGGGSLPANIQTVGDLINNKGSLLKSLGATPVGLYQINAGTWQEFAPTALGKGWEGANVRDPMVQDKIGEAIWNSAKGSVKAITGRWASLNPAEAAAMVGKPWAAVRDKISSGESGVSASSVLADVAANRTIDQIGALTGDMQRNASNINNDYVTAAQDKRSPGDIIAEAAKDPLLSGMDVPYLRQQVAQIQATASKANKPINAAIAVAILKQAADSSWGSRNLPWILGGGDKNGVYIDSRKVDKLIKDYSAGNVEQGVLANANSAAQQAQAAQLDGLAQQAAARYTTAANANANQGKNIDLTPLYQQMIAAAAAAKAAHQGNTNSGSNAYNTPTPADTKPAAKGPSGNAGNPPAAAVIAAAVSGGRSSANTRSGRVYAKSAPPPPPPRVPQMTAEQLRQFAAMGTPKLFMAR
jgi:hypothetical protein